MNFQKLTEYLDQVEARYGVPACECMIYKDHAPVYHHTAGHFDYEGKIPLKGGEWYWIYSCSKLMTMTAVMQLWEQGKLDLDDPVSRYLPECAHMTVREGDTVRPARTVMTLRHLMTMTGGFTYDQTLPELMKVKKERGEAATTREMIAGLLREPLAFDPGTHYEYSMCHDVIAVVVEAVSGERFSDYVLNHIARPLGITGLTFHPGEKELSNMPGQICYREETGDFFRCGTVSSHKLTESYDSGGAGVCCRAEDYILFLDALANGGVGKNGYRVLTEKSIAEMTRNQLSGQAEKDFHIKNKPETEVYGLGMAAHVADDGMMPVGSFGWDGAAGASSVVDPENHVAFFYAQHVLGYLRNYTELHPGLWRCAFEGVLEK